MEPIDDEAGDLVDIGEVSESEHVPSSAENIEDETDLEIPEQPKVHEVQPMPDLLID